MVHNSFRLLLLLFSLLLTVTGCQQHNDPFPGESEVRKGRIVLALSDIEVYTSDVQTRAITTLDDFAGYVFTLNGETIEGETVQNKVISFTGNVAIIEAGTYSLSVNNNTSSLINNGCPNYSGTTEEDFTLDIGGTANVTISMGTPKNAKITLAYSEEFASKYNNICVTFTSGSRSVKLGQTEGCYTEAYFPEGSVNYTITAFAKENTHITDVNAIGSLTLSSGKHSVLTLEIDPVTGEIIPFGEGTHNGEFDTKEYRPLN